MKLSAHFTLEEMTFSETAIRAGKPVDADEHVISQLERLCALVLEPLREAVGGPIYISSGYRPRWLNEMVGGSINSDHLYGRAADIRAVGRTPLELCRMARDLYLPCKQIIHEFGRWAHLSIPNPGDASKRQLLTAARTRFVTHYVPGLLEIEDAISRV